MMHRRIKSVVVGLLLILTACLGNLAYAVSPDQGDKSGVLPSLSQRFAPKTETPETPDFQRHVSPLLGRLGCNGRACHGSFQGRGGFQLSLFGYDFGADHKALMEEDTLRVDQDDIPESLILAKPTDAELHEGGKRFDLDGWQYQVLSKWIEGGAKFDSKQIHKLKRLEIQPTELIFTQQNQSTSLRAIAHWEDGTREDVTEICRFHSNDSAKADIDETGKVTSKSAGDTHVVVSYDNAVVPVPVLRPVSNLAGDSYPKSKERTEIDRLVKQKLQKLGIVPSKVCSDEEFLRRAHLDIAGTLPTQVEVENFMADTDKDKRSKKVDELLTSPGYAAWWTTKFCDWTGNNDAKLNNVSPVSKAPAEHWYAWIHKRLQDNVPYDKIVEGIVLANSREEGESYLDYCEAMGETCGKQDFDKFADRSGLPYFWARNNFKSTEDRAIGFAYTFLGVRIQCAQCHKHPFDQWSKQDFDEFKNLFQTVTFAQKPRRGDGLEEYNAMMEKFNPDGKLRGGQLRRMLYSKFGEGETIPFGELVERPIRGKTTTIRKKGQKAKKVVDIPKAKLLGSDYVQLNEMAREKLMDWLREKDNPYFAKAIVNRVWHNYFGVGIVDPVDDLNLANPPSNAALMDYLAERFVENGYNLKWLHREITTSDAYQRSWETNDTNALDKTNFSHFLPRRLPAEVLYDAVLIATASDTEAIQLCSSKDNRAVALAAASARAGRNGPTYALSVFGRSIRESNCDCDRSEEPNLLQTVYLQNDQDMNNRLFSKNGWIAQQMRELGQPMPYSLAAESAKKKRVEDGRKRQLANVQAQKKALQKKLKAAKAAEGVSEKVRNQRIRTYERQLAAIEHRAKSINKTAEKNLPREVSKDQLNKLVQDAYLRTLSRQPSETEFESSLAYLADTDSLAEGVGGLLWALINTKEFILNH